MKSYKRMKKAAKGLQSVAVPEQGDASNVLSSTTSLASAGSQFGPWGAAAGGIVGLGVGLFQKNKQDAENKGAITRNKFLTANRSVAGDDESIDQKPQRFKRGTRGLDTKVIEIEGKKYPEIHTDKNYNVKNLGTTPHSKGGNKVEAAEGDIVFNTQDSGSKYKRIAKAINEGDKTTLNKEKNKLPEDNSMKAQTGKRVKVQEPDYLTEEEKREAKGLPKPKYMQKRAMGLPSSRPVNPSTGNKYPVKGKLTPASKRPSMPYHTNSYGDKIYEQTPVDNKPTYKTGSNAKYKPTIGGSNLGFIPNIFEKRNNGSKQAVLGSPKENAVQSTMAPSKPSTFNLSNPLAIPGIPKPNTGISATIPSSKSPVSKQGKKISGSTVPVLNPVKKFDSSMLVPKDINGQGDGSDLREKAKPFAFSDTTKATPTTSSSAKTGSPTSDNESDTGSKINSALQLTGVANNLFQGLKGEKKINETYLEPEKINYTDRSESSRQRSNSLANVQSSNARNLSGGLASNIRANQQQANLSNLGRQNAIDEREMGRRDQIQAQNTQAINQTNQINASRKDMYEQQTAGTRAAKQAYVDQAASDLGQLGMAKQEEAYMRSRDDKAYRAQEAGLRSINTMTPDFETDVDGNRKFKPKYKKGTKYIKMDKPSQASSQDSTSPKNMYKGNSSSGEGGFNDLKKTTKAATAILGLTKAIPTPLTQAIGWGASGISAGIGVNDAIDNTKKGKYKEAALDAGGAALDLVPLNLSRVGRVGKTIDLLKKGSQVRNVRTATNIGVRAAQAAALTNDEEDIRGAYKKGTKGVSLSKYKKK